MLFASYLLLGRNKCEIMLAMDCEYEAAKCRSEFFHSIEEKRVTRQTNKQGNTDSNIILVLIMSRVLHQEHQISSDVL